MNNKIHVLQVINSLRRGGAETFLMNLFRQIDREHFRFSFLLNQDGGTYLDWVKEEGADVYFIPPRNQGIGNYIQNLDFFFASHQGAFDVVHQHLSSLTSIEPLMVARKYGVPIRIVHSHSSFPEGKMHRLLHYLNQLSVVYAANQYMACSENSKKWTYKIPLTRHKTQIVKNGIETELYKYNRTTRLRLRRELGFNEEVVVGHVGRFHEVKNHQFLLQVFKEFLKIEPRARLLLVGEGELLPSIQEKVHAYKMDEVVHFVGLRDDVSSLLQAMDALVFPSIKEGLPLSLIEAQCAGLSVVASSSIDRQAKLSDRFFFQSLNCTPRVWAETLKDALRYDLIDREKGIDIVRKNGFDIKTTVRMLEKHYTKSN